MTISPTVPSSAISLLPRGNLLLQSQAFNLTPWSPTGASVTANAGSDVYGLTTADKLARTTTGASYILQYASKAASAIAYTFSIYAQLGSGAYFPVRLNGVNPAVNRADVVFNLSTGQIASAPVVTGAFSNTSATITAAGGGWYRCTFTATSNTDTSITAVVSSSTVSQQVDGTGSANSTYVYLWGAQLEPYAQASAYAATTTAADPGIWAGTQSLAVLPFLPGQSVSVTKAPQWSTEVIRTASGRERRTAYWPYPLWRFELQYEVVRHRPANDELAAMWEFFNLALGQFAPWLFVDPSDCQVASTTPVQFGTGNGSTTTFQLTRTLNSFAEPVYGAYQPVILDNGAPTTASLSFSPNGQVTFGAPPASGHVLSWFGYFYFGCRFLTDDLGFEQVVPQLWAGKSLKFSSLRA